MKSFTRILSSIGGLIISICLVTLWGIGVVHSYKKHSKIDTVISLFPVWGVYRGAESFWHPKDKAINASNVNDVNTLLELIGDSDNPEQYPLVNEEINRFSIKISSYSAEAKSNLKGVASNYIKYNLYTAKDLISCYKEMGAGQQPIYTESANQKLSYDSLLNYYGVEYVRLIRQMTDSTVHSMKSTDYDLSAFPVIINKMDSLTTYRVKTMEDAYYRIFNEQLSLVGD